MHDETASSKVSPARPMTAKAPPPMPIAIPPIPTTSEMTMDIKEIAFAFLAGVLTFRKWALERKLPDFSELP